MEISGSKGFHSFLFKRSMFRILISLEAAKKMQRVADVQAMTDI